MSPRSLILAALLSLSPIAVAHARPKHAAPPPPRRIAIAVTSHGFEPAHVEVKKGEPVVLVFTRTTDVTCAKDIVVATSEAAKVSRHLPLGAPVAVEARFDRAGELRYACSMDMVSGVIRVE